MDFAPLGRGLILMGLVILALGVLLAFSDRVPLIGRLPGDVTLGGDRWTVYVPIATSIVLSVLLTLGLTLFAWLGRR